MSRRHRGDCEESRAPVPLRVGLNCAMEGSVKRVVSRGQPPLDRPPSQCVFEGALLMRRPEPDSAGPRRHEAHRSSRVRSTSRTILGAPSAALPMGGSDTWSAIPVLSRCVSLARLVVLQHTAVGARRGRLRFQIAATAGAVGAAESGHRLRRASAPRSPTAPRPTGALGRHTRSLSLGARRASARTAPRRDSPRSCCMVASRHGRDRRAHRRSSALHRWGWGGLPRCAGSAGARPERLPCGVLTPRGHAPRRSSAVGGLRDRGRGLGRVWDTELLRDLGTAGGQLWLRASTPRVFEAGRVVDPMVLVYFL